MTPVGHLSASYLLSRLSKQPPIPLCVAGLAPDMDFLLLLIDPERFNALHRVVTHSIFFVALVAALLCLRWRRPSVLATAFVSGLLHLMIDAVLDGNTSNGVGVAVLWPLSSQVWSPFNLFDGWLVLSPAGWADLSQAVRLALVSFALECPLAFVACSLWLNRRRIASGAAAQISNTR